MGARHSPKPLHRQVLVITGASSGIGLATARLAAERGARVVLTSEDPEALYAAQLEIEEAGGRATALPADVADLEALRAVAAHAVQVFGGFDTWINNAGVRLIGAVEQVPEEDARRLLDVNYWGVVHGCRAALPHLRERGGVIVNLGGVLSSRPVPLQGFYAASQHAVQGYTHTLRMELAAEGAPVHVALAKLATIERGGEARPHLGGVDRPSVAARALLHLAEHPRRDLAIGGVGALAVLGEAHAPSIFELVRLHTRAAHRALAALALGGLGAGYLALRARRTRPPLAQRLVRRLAW